jgi:hypothetical protein
MPAQIAWSRSLKVMRPHIATLIGCVTSMRSGKYRSRVRPPYSIGRNIAGRVEKIAVGRISGALGRHKKVQIACLLANREYVALKMLRGAAARLLLPDSV